MVRNYLVQRVVCLFTNPKALQLRKNSNYCFTGKPLCIEFVCKQKPIWQRSVCTNLRNSDNVIQLKPQEFCNVLKKHKTRRCLLWYNKEKGKIEVSHPFLEEFADFISKNERFRGHEAIFMELGKRTDALLTAFLWKSSRGQAHGGVRLWNYDNMASLIQEGLRLSAANGVKAALAGLWVSGGQGIIPELPDREHLTRNIRQELFYDYGDFLSGLNGSFVAAEDVGVNVYDMNSIHLRTRYLTGTAEDIGGLGNLAFATAEAVICSIEGTLDFLKMGTLEGKTIAVQGAGNVGSLIISQLLDRNVSQVYVTECQQKLVDDIRDLFAVKAKGRLEITRVPFGDRKILERKCDVLCPCAFGNTVTDETLPLIQAKIICGPATNQISPDLDKQLIIDSGITIIGDIVSNRMGMVSQAVEAQGRLLRDPVFKQHFNKDWENSIFVITQKVLKSALNSNSSPEAAAMTLAETVIDQCNPLWPKRTKMILQDLIENKWFEDKDFWLRRSNFPSARNIW